MSSRLDCDERKRGTLYSLEDEMANTLSPQTLAALRAKFTQPQAAPMASPQAVPNAYPQSVIPGGVPAERGVPANPVAGATAQIQGAARRPAAPQALPNPQANPTQIAPTGDTSWDRFCSYSNSGMPLGGAAQ
jgi:hypothetical protein